MAGGAHHLAGAIQELNKQIKAVSKDAKDQKLVENLVGALEVVETLGPL